jgi:hypothetical protein
MTADDLMESDRTTIDQTITFGSPVPVSSPRRKSFSALGSSRTPGFVHIV